MFDVFVMNMGGHDENLKQIVGRLPHAQKMRYHNRHLDMVNRAANRSRTEFFWLIASCCDYTDFDFNYVPLAHEQKQIHCWSSGKQKFGDTLLVNVAAWKEQSKVEKLEWYHDVNYHPNGPARLPWPRIDAGSNLAQSIKEHDFASIYATFYAPGSDGSASHDVNLWEDREIIAFNRTGHVSMCPSDAKQAIKTQIYDWPYIKYQVDPNVTQKTQDVVFISYDEENAEKHWQELAARKPDAQRVHGVSGLFNALKAAAKLATTDWFYAVFAKTQIDPGFGFDYKPDYLRHPANYVFQAYNPVLDHSYGHGAVVLHNREWLLSNDDPGGDITMAMPVVSVPIVSCINNYNETPWSAYRTAFREAYKLKSMPGIEDQYHLHLWLSSDKGLNGKWSQLGASDAAESAIIDVNDWDALKDRFEKRWNGSI